MTDLYIDDRELHQELDRMVSELSAELVTLRRELHAHPEVSWKEHETQRRLAAFLARHGVETSVTAGTGLYADIGPTADRRVFYRGDIDALPIVDTKDPSLIPYASQNAGVCHSCGHDVHATIAAGVAVIVRRLADRLRHPVRVVLQPAEEVIPSGAEQVAEEGVLDGGIAGFALHVDPARNVGEIAMRSGAISAADDEFTIEIVGSGGHSARPHLSRDAIAAGAAVVQHLYLMVREIADPVEPSVLAIGSFHAGTAANVITGQATLQGKVRTVALERRQELHEGIQRTATHAAALHGCEAKVSFAYGSPPVRNHARLMPLIQRCAEATIGPDKITYLQQASTGAEDFGVFSDHMPTFMFRLGCATPGQQRRHLHEEGFDLDEGAIAVGLRTMLRALLSIAQQDDETLRLLSER